MFSPTVGRRTAVSSDSAPEKLFCALVPGYSMPGGCVRRTLLVSRRLGEGAATGDLVTAHQERERESQSTQRHQAPGAVATCPRPVHAVEEAGALSRLGPLSTSSTVGSGSPLRGEAVPKRGRSNAGFRDSLEYTARASLGARAGRALAWPGLRASVAKYALPGGVWRQKRIAASEKAHLSWGVPIFLPEPPCRLPADSLAHCTTRQ
jgi:hypothetical protein